MRKVFVQMEDGTLIEVHSITARRSDDGELRALLMHEGSLLPYAIVPIEYVANDEGFEVIVNGLVMTLKELIDT